MKKYRVAVLTGGYSPEWEISLQTGQTIIGHLSQDHFEALELRILTSGWNVMFEGEAYPVDKRDMSWRDADGISRHFDLAFMAIHGHPGENGVLQGYLETLGIPLAGSGVFSSALSFNKAQTSAYVKRFGLNVARSVLFRRGNTLNEEEIIAELGLPLFVKPNRSGSSFGISRVDEKQALAKAVNTALAYDELVVIEEAIIGTELACGISDHTGQAEVLGITEIVPKNRFFDYESKYSGESEEITPARISTEVQKKLESQSLLVYQELELKGIARIDFILSADGIPYMIEANSVPGMSSASIVPQQIKWKGLALSDIFEKMARSCLPPE